MTHVRPLTQKRREEFARLLEDKRKQKEGDLELGYKFLNEVESSFLGKLAKKTGAVS